MMTAIDMAMGFCAGVVVMASAVGYALQWAKRERDKLIADYDLQIEGMATLHKAAVKSMQEVHKAELKHWETTVSEIRERSQEHARRAAAMEEAVRQAWASGRVIGDALASAMKEAGRASE